MTTGGCFQPLALGDSIHRCAWEQALRHDHTVEIAQLMRDLVMADTPSVDHLAEALRPCRFPVRRSGARHFVILQFRRHRSDHSCHLFSQRDLRSARCASSSSRGGRQRFAGLCRWSGPDCPAAADRAASELPVVRHGERRVQPHRGRNRWRFLHRHSERQSPRRCSRATQRPPWHDADRLIPRAAGGRDERARMYQPAASTSALSAIQPNRWPSLWIASSVPR